jgi:hypothetical protein
MTIYFASNEDIDFDKVGTPVISTTRFRAGYARYSLESSVTDYWCVPLSTPLSEFYFQCRVQIQEINSLNQYALLRFGTDSGNAYNVFRITGDQANSCKVELWNGSTFTNLGSITGLYEINFTTNTTLKLQVYAKIAADGQIVVKVNDTVGFTYSGDTRGGASKEHTEVGYISLASNTAWSSYRCCYSEVIVTSNDPSLMSVVSLAPNGAGTHSDWVGAYTDINEKTEDQDTFISTTDADSENSFTVNDLPEDQRVLAVIVSAKANRGADGPQNVQLGLRTNSTDYYSSSKALTETFTRISEQWNTNPATGLEWESSDISDIQCNIKSIA